jgi:hypothetical protein
MRIIVQKGYRKAKGDLDGGKGDDAGMCRDRSIFQKNVESKSKDQKYPNASRKKKVA